MSVTATRAPPAASRRATACPMPWPAAAVTSATRPPNSSTLCLFSASLPGQAEDLLGQDVALHLGGARVDGAGPGVEEGAEPGAGGVGRAGVVGAHRAQRAAARRHQTVQATDVQGEFGRGHVVLTPVQF